MNNLSVKKVVPPQGYLGINYEFPDPNPNNQADPQKPGLYNYDYDFSLGSNPDTRVGTFLSFNAKFNNSDKDLPPYHVGGIQGGYFGVQVLSPGVYQAIFSIWWALAAEAGPEGQTVDNVEAWYSDDDPWNPPITNPPWPTGRKWAGGPFRSCRTPISLEENTNYRIRIWEESQGNGWWGSWLINLSTNEQQFIGKIQVPAHWGRLNGDHAGGFMEFFNAMPNGCDSIPGSTTSILNGKANNGTQTGKTSVNLYGQCEQNLSPRTSLNCDDTGCTVIVQAP